MRYSWKGYYQIQCCALMGYAAYRLLKFSPIGQW